MTTDTGLAIVGDEISDFSCLRLFRGSPDWIIMDRKNHSDADIVASVELGKSYLAITDAGEGDNDAIQVMISEQILGAQLVVDHRSLVRLTNMLDKYHLVSSYPTSDSVFFYFVKDGETGGSYDLKNVLDSLSITAMDQQRVIEELQLISRLGLVSQAVNTFPRFTEVGTASPRVARIAQKVYPLIRSAYRRIPKRA